LAGSDSWSLTVDAVSVAVAALSAGPHRLHNDSVASQNTGADPAVEKGKPLVGLADRNGPSQNSEFF
jgi:hypothetical protein